jgi:hypothetical protein
MFNVVSPSLPVVSSQPSTSKGAESSSADKASPAQLDMDEDVVGLRSRKLSSTLHKLYLWEKKLYNEVKVCSIMLNSVIKLASVCSPPMCFVHNMSVDSV